MKLKCEGAISSAYAEESDIRKAFSDDQGRGDFIILSVADEVYIQASGEGDGPYTLEYREGGENRHYQCTRDVTKTEVESVFLKYLKQDITWITDFQWKKLESEPWWKFW